MFITLKNLQQETFILEFDDSQMVIKLKEKIEAERGKNYPAENQKLIYAGMILDDNRTVASYNVDEKKFIVVMVKKVTKSTTNVEMSPSGASAGISTSSGDTTGVGGTTTGIGTTVASTASSTATIQSKNDKLNLSSGDNSNKMTEQQQTTCKLSTTTTTTDDVNTSAEKIIKMEIVDNKIVKSSDTTNKLSDCGGNSGVGGSNISTTTSGNKKLDGIGESNVVPSSSINTSTSVTVTGGAGATTSSGGGGNVIIGDTGGNVQSSAESALIMGHEYDSIVQNIVEMGYRRPLVEQALRASFNNPDRAVEYLINGIPDTNEEMDLDRSTAVAIGSAQTMPTVGLSDASDPLAFLRQQPQFQQMRTVLHRNPELLNAVLQQIGLTNPALLQLISENQQAFVNMLNERDGNGVGGDATLPAALMASLSGATTGGGGGNTGGNVIAVDGGGGGGGRATETGGSGGGGNTVGGENVPSDGSSGIIAVNPQDRESIERLKALGFPEHLVLQAYFACEKNENLAANFLLSQNFDEF